MNIKHITLGGLLVCLCIAYSSCNKDLLDKNPPDSVSTDIFWASETDVQNAVAGVYSRLQQNFLGYERVYLDGLSDNAYAWDNNNQLQLYNITIGSISASTGGAINNMYSSPYRAITSCNYFLDNVDKAPVTDVKKNAYKAEVRFIRALAYFDLVQAFGGVPLYRNFFTTLESAKIAKSTREQVYAFIEEDLDFAIANLPDDKYNGHAVKGSALGLKARVLITEQKWSDALPLLQQVMSSGKFALSNNYTTLFRTAGQTNAAVNTEIMFSTQYLATTNPQRTSPGAAGMDIELGWYSLLQPYQDLVNDYEMTDGKPITESPLYNAATPYTNRDPRLDLTVKLPGETWRNNSGTAWTGSYNSATGFLVEKYVDLSKAPFTTATATQTDQDFIHLRYADVLLMFAEAKNEVSGPDATVYAAMNQVRARTGINMPPVDQVKYNTQAKLRDYIRHERRVEFAFEGQRYNDLKRWNIAHIKLPTLTSPSGVPLRFETKNYLLPFSQSELDNNPQLVQNTGY
jgi:starch-binding outer membrane protein, SusD/RagB family